jgi:hypothetical protein
MSISIAPIIILCDVREPHILGELQQINSPVATIISGKMTIGDFAIVDNENVYAVIERKTMNDLIASIKDGRINNREKLIKMRHKRADIFYLLEVDAGDKYLIAMFDPADKTIGSQIIKGGLRRQVIASFINNAIVRDKIPTLYSDSRKQTAEVLLQLAYSYSRHGKLALSAQIAATNVIIGASNNSVPPKCDANFTAAPETGAKGDIPRTMSSSSYYFAPETAQKTCAPDTSVGALMAPPTHSDIYRAILIEVPGITRETAINYMSCTLVEHVTYADEYKGLAKSSFKHLLSGKELYWRIMSKIPGVSEPIVSALSTTFDMRDFINICEKRPQMLAQLGQKQCAALDHIVFYTVSFRSIDADTHTHTTHITS